MNQQEPCPRCGHSYSTREVEVDFEGICPGCLAMVARGEETDISLSPGLGEVNTVPDSQDPPLKTGTIFAGLEVLELLGRGGMGFVYKVRQPDLDRFIALKILSPHLAGDPEFARRFNREAQALAALDHPNIVRIIDYGKEGGLYFLTMEFVDGPSLREVIQQGELTPSEALKVVPQICDALEYAHSEGIIHRDIKPENIILDRKGRARIADFGLAKIRGRETGNAGLTRTAVVMGTPQYMAPEQYDNLKEADHRADIYSLGVVFYEMLTGELPVGRFELPSKRVIIDVRLDDVVLKAMEANPDQRYQRAEQIKTDVEIIGEQKPQMTPVQASREKPVETDIEIIKEPDPPTAPVHHPPGRKKSSKKLPIGIWLASAVILVATMAPWGSFPETPQVSETPHVYWVDRDGLEMVLTGWNGTWRSPVGNMELPFWSIIFAGLLAGLMGSMRALDRWRSWRFLDWIPLVFGVISLTEVFMVLIPRGQVGLGIVMTTTGFICLTAIFAGKRWFIVTFLIFLLLPIMTGLGGGALKVMRIIKIQETIGREKPATKFSRFIKGETVLLQVPGFRTLDSGKPALIPTEGRKKIFRELEDAGIIILWENPDLVLLDCNESELEQIEHTMGAMAFRDGNLVNTIPALKNGRLRAVNPEPHSVLYCGSDPIVITYCHTGKVLSAPFIAGTTPDGRPLMEAYLQEWNKDPRVSLVLSRTSYNGIELHIRPRGNTTLLEVFLLTSGSFGYPEGFPQGSGGFQAREDIRAFILESLEKSQLDPSRQAEFDRFMGTPVPSLNDPHKNPSGYAGFITSSLDFMAEGMGAPFLPVQKFRRKQISDRLERGLSGVRPQGYTDRRLAILKAQKQYLADMNTLLTEKQRELFRENGAFTALFPIFGRGLNSRDDQAAKQVAGRWKRIMDLSADQMVTANFAARTFVRDMRALTLQCGIKGGPVPGEDMDSTISRFEYRIESIQAQKNALGLLWKKLDLNQKENLKLRGVEYYFPAHPPEKFNTRLIHRNEKGETWLMDPNEFDIPNHLEASRDNYFFTSTIPEKRPATSSAKEIITHKGSFFGISRGLMRGDVILRTNVFADAKPPKMVVHIQRHNRNLVVEYRANIEKEKADPKRDLEQLELLKKIIDDRLERLPEKNK